MEIEFYDYLAEKRKRLRCPKCGRYCKKPVGLESDQEVDVTCSKEHIVTYHEPYVPIIYYIQENGDDANNGLSVSSSLKTLSEAIKHCSLKDIIMIER